MISLELAVFIDSVTTKRRIFASFQRRHMIFSFWTLYLSKSKMVLVPKSTTLASVDPARIDFFIFF